MSEKTLQSLIEDFDRNIETYKTNVYNEANTRTQFIDKFFKLLGWDVDNNQGFSEAYKEVVHEDSLKIGSYMKAPDYSFRLGGSRVFFVEAKKPSINIKTDIVPAYQLRRYGWTAKLPVSILTDFEEFAVYDCRVKPNKTDKASTARILYFTYKEFLEKWDEIYSLFAKENILKGSLDNFVKSAKKIKGTSEVDKEFLKEISSWRDVLAKNIALRNSNLSSRELNFCVQRTIDRIIFLRMCEDRGIEDYGRLKVLTNGGRIYPRLFQLFQAADDRYNSGLFYFRKEKGREELPDEVSPFLEIDDKILRNILSGLYYPDCPYEFSVLPADILGNVYEQFLGKVIRLTASHQAKIEEKPEVKKAGGVYYTPKYIVDYIVENTVGKALERKSPFSKGGKGDLKILDPACGSGSFLLGAYQYLLDWYLKYYSENEPKKWLKKKNPPIYVSRIFQREKVSGGFKLTTSEKKRILLNHIYGVDIDSQAVEVTKLSLLLKVLEDENQDTLENQLKLFHERALPDLSRNIKCGNSLIGPDFYENQQLDLLDEEEQLKINVFDWQSSFPDVFNRQNPGFDIVIGNPPYLKETNNRQLFEKLRKCNTKKYCVGKMDLWYAFACKSIDLIRTNGLHSFIATNNWTTNYGASELRKKVMAECQIIKYIDFADFKVFHSASIQTMIYIMQKKNKNQEYNAKWLKFNKKSIPIEDINEALYSSNYWNEAIINPNGSSHPFTLVTNDIRFIINKLKSKGNKLFLSSEIGNGIDVLQDFVKRTHLPKLTNQNVSIGDGVFVLNQSEKNIVSTTSNDERKIKPYYTSLNLGRYKALLQNVYWLIYADKEVRKNINLFPGIKNHLDKFRRIMTSVYKPYGLHRPRDENFFNGSNILSLRKTRIPSFAFVDFPCYISRAFLVIKTDNWKESPLYLLGILNSCIIKFWLYYCGKKQGDQLQIDKEPLLNIPIRKIEFSDPTDKKRHDQMTKYVDRMLELHKRLEKVKTPYEKTQIQNQISATNKAIDKLVFELYELTEEEINIVKKTTK